MFDYTEEDIINTIYEIALPNTNNIKLDSKITELNVNGLEIPSRESLLEFIEMKKKINNINFDSVKQEAQKKCIELFDVFIGKGKKRKMEMLEDYFDMIDIDIYDRIDMKKTFFSNNLTTNREIEEQFFIHLNRTLCLYLSMKILGQHRTTIEEMHRKYVICD